MNKLDREIRLVWNDVTVTDSYGSSSRIMKSGTRYIDRMDPIPNSTIPRGASLEDFFLPVSNVYYSNGWQTRDLFDINTLGEEYGLYLALKIDGEIKSYNFKFRQMGYPISDLPLKSKLAAGLWGLFPSAGHAYAGNWTRGIPFLAGTFVLAPFFDEEAEEGGIAEFLYLILKVYEIYDAVKLVDNYNDALIEVREESINILKKETNISLLVKPNSIGLSYRF